MRVAIVCALLLVSAANALAESQEAQPRAAPPQVATPKQPPQRPAPQPVPPPKQVAPAQPKSAPPKGAPPQPDPGQARAAPPKRDRIVERIGGQGNDLLGCFEGVTPKRTIDLIVEITYDGKKLRSRIKQAQQSTQQIDACVVKIFDGVAVRLPAERLPDPIEIPVRYTPPLPGA